MEVREDVLLPDRLWIELVQWRAGYQCERCGRDRRGLRKDGFSGQIHAHHKDHNHDNNRLDNGECVCPSCHGKEHGGKTKPCQPGCTCGRHRGVHKCSCGECLVCRKRKWSRESQRRHKQRQVS